MKIKIISPLEAAGLLARRKDSLTEAIEVVKPILEAVESRGDAAVKEFAAKFDGFSGSSFEVDRQELVAARQALEPSLFEAINIAIANVKAFAELQIPKDFMAELAPGHRVGQVIRPLETVAAYIPGGRYPLPSTVLMTSVPASVAGVPNIWVTTPKPNPTILAAAEMAKATNVALIGGAQAIAAFAFGTETIPKANRIVGPGNIYVTAAKKLLAGEVGIDFVAGPTEVVIVANEGNPSWIAADMLAQAEHDTDASAFLFTMSPELASQVSFEIETQIKTLPTAQIATVALEKNSAIILCESMEQLLEMVNDFAAEHLCLHDPALLSKIRNAGSIFLGAGTPEAAGDYITGPNHTLPTAGAAHLRGGLSVTDFVKVITVQELSAEALGRVGTAGATLARAEGLEGHARSIEVRTQ